MNGLRKIQEPEERINMALEIAGVWHWFNMPKRHFDPVVPHLPEPVRLALEKQSFEEANGIANAAAPA